MRRFLGVLLLLAVGSHLGLSLQPAAEGLATAAVRSQAQRRQSGPSDGHHGTPASADVLASHDVRSTRKDSVVKVLYTGDVIASVTVRPKAQRWQSDPSEVDHGTPVWRGSGHLLKGANIDPTGALIGHTKILGADGMPLRDPGEGGEMMARAESRADKEDEQPDPTSQHYDDTLESEDIAIRCGKTCEEAVHGGAACKATWTSVCKSNDPPPGFGTDPELYDVCPVTCGPRPEVVESASPPRSCLSFIIIPLSVYGLFP